MANELIAQTSLQLADRQERPDKHCTGGAPSATVTRLAELPMSFAQQRQWLRYQADPDNVGYNMTYALRLSGPLDVDALSRSLNEIVRRHEVLRTSFDNIAGQPMQLIAESQILDFEVVDLIDLPDTKRDERVRNLVSEEAKRPFDLRTGPLLRHGLVRLEEEEHVFWLITHHIIFDAWSAGVLFGELCRLYASYREGSPPELEELPIQYGDFAVWERNWLSGTVLEDQLSYWRKQLRGLKSLELPTDRQGQSSKNLWGASLPITLAPALTKCLRHLCRREGVTLYMLLLATFQHLLSRYTKQEDISVGAPAASRTEPGTELLIGLFTNGLVMRIDLGGNPTFRQLLRRAREVTLEAYQRQNMRFEKLVEALAAGPEPFPVPPFRVMFSMQSAPTSGLQLPGLSVSILSLGDDTGRRFLLRSDLDFYLWEAGTGLNGAWVYNPSAFVEADIAHLVQRFQTLLELVADDPDLSLDDLERKATGSTSLGT
jgi:hypothetical protein